MSTTSIPPGGFPSGFQLIDSDEKASRLARELARLTNDTSINAVGFWVKAINQSAFEMAKFARLDAMSDHVAQNAPGSPTAPTELNRSANETLQLARIRSNV